MVGEPVPELGDSRVGVRYSWIAGDLRRAGVERRGGLAADVRETLRWARGARHSVWDPRDPGPARYLAAARLRPGAAGTTDAVRVPGAGPARARG
ncbi:hypothetical protein [Cellulomonas sp. ATA003]|uniref:hypothetical protein n=1 Tax=Cellulomonas sp. ATA003 TaxID=3073064 RepID=UPI0028731C0C|nr:hypothetical protein [Cellulomonas sp. ATA003]WNB85827.1 hypothetical protein REH70_00270 [Cellulomonas sp. ATA003]